LPFTTSPYFTWPSISLMTAGSFGRRANFQSDYVVDCVHVAKHVGGGAGGVDNILCLGHPACDAPL